MTLPTDLPTLPTLSLTALQGAEGAAQGTATTTADGTTEGTPPTRAPEGMIWVPFALIFGTTWATGAATISSGAAAA